ncbi:twin-arginine translocase TatA/TatE family subunit [Olsenella urininfantis]|uniref:twin-arginine translocase TatA/TatE family subunit n=1 Tax=Olsenella urininfantis TaxID=1871033 RepID=UPI000BE7FAA3|nr:twin-arginine translocase TatA/TatE family subunit [Olsenella urininfantis]
MFGIGESELLIIVVFGFLLFGPDKLPGMGRTIGRALRQFRVAQEGFTEVVQSEVMDPLNKVMNEGIDTDPKSSKRAAALDEDADAEEGDVPKKRANETFAERKARLEAERKARDAQGQPDEGADGGPLAGPSGDEGTDAPAEEQPGGEVAQPEEEKAPDTSAAALYARRPKREATEPAELSAEPPVADASADASADLTAEEE